MCTTEQDRKSRVLWLFTGQKTEIDIHSAVAGNSSVGELLGYPKCCTDGYLQLQANLIENDMASYSKYHGAKDDDDFISCYRAMRPLGEGFDVQLGAIRNEIQSRQALTIKQYPFVHFIACRECLKSPHSPASTQDAEMSELAHFLSPTFARKFKAYADYYFSHFQRSRGNCF
jgi:hypothetical protein